MIDDKLSEVQLFKVYAEIYQKNHETIFINSETAIYNKLNNNTNLLGQAKVVNSEDKIVGTWGEYNEIIRNGKKYLVHKWKNEEKEY